VAVCLTTVGGWLAGWLSGVLSVYCVKMIGVDRVFCPAVNHALFLCLCHR